MANPNPSDEPNKELIEALVDELGPQQLTDRVKRLEDRVKRLEDAVFNGGGGIDGRFKLVDGQISLLDANIRKTIRATTAEVSARVRQQIEQQPLLLGRRVPLQTRGRRYRGAM
jgi:hypothetical protein